MINYGQIGRQITDYLWHNRQQMHDFLALLVKTESPSSVPETQAQIFTILDDVLSQQNYRTRILQGEKTGGSLLAIPCDRHFQQPNQLLLGHTDTVWPLNSLKRMPVITKHGKLYGPGVYDMKAGIMFMIFALKALNYLESKSTNSPKA